MHTIQCGLSIQGQPVYARDAQSDDWKSLTSNARPTGSIAHASSEINGSLEPLGEPVPVGIIPIARRELDLLASQHVSSTLKHPPIVHRQQRLADMNAEVRIGPDEIGIEGGMMGF